VWLCVERSAICEHVVSPWTTPQDCRDNFFDFLDQIVVPAILGSKFKFKIFSAVAPCLQSSLYTHLGHIHVLAYVINEGAVKTRVVRKVRNSHAHNLIAAPRSVSLRAIPVNNFSLGIDKIGLGLGFIVLLARESS
jgi:hypothetical protein